MITTQRSFSGTIRKIRRVWNTMWCRLSGHLWTVADGHTGGACEFCYEEFQGSPEDLARELAVQESLQTMSF